MYILGFPVLGIVSSSHNISSHSTIFLLSLIFRFHCMNLSKWTSQILTQFTSTLGWNSTLGGVYIWLHIPSKIILQVFTAFTLILPRSSMTKCVYVRLYVHSKIILQILASLFQDLWYTHVVTWCVMMVVIQVGACRVFCIIFNCASCVFICMIW